MPGLNPLLSSRLRRACVEWDLTAVPSTSNITSAYVNITVTQTPMDPYTDSDFVLRAIEVPWIEGAIRGGEPVRLSTHAKWGVLERLA